MVPLDIMIGYWNGYNNVMESLCNGWLCCDGYVVVVYGYVVVIVMVLQIMFSSVMDMCKNIWYMKRR